MIDATRRKRRNASLKSIPPPPSPAAAAAKLSLKELIGPSPSALATFGAHFCFPRLMVHLHLYCLNFISPRSNNFASHFSYSVLSFTTVNAPAVAPLTSRGALIIFPYRRRAFAKNIATFFHENKTPPQNAPNVYAGSRALARARECDFNVDPRTARQYVLERGVYKHIPTSAHKLLTYIRPRGRCYLLFTEQINETGSPCNIVA